MYSRCAYQTHASLASGLARRWCQASMSSSVAGRLRSTKMPVLYALQHVLPEGEIRMRDARVLGGIGIGITVHVNSEAVQSRQ